MGNLFLPVMLIYSLSSCGLLLAAFAKPDKSTSDYLRAGIWTICVHLGYKLMWVAFAAPDRYELPIPFGLAYPVMLYLAARGYYKKDGVIPRRTNLLLCLPYFIHLFSFLFLLLPNASDYAQMLYAKCYYASAMLTLLAYALATVGLYSRYKGVSTPTDILIRQLTAMSFGVVVLSFLVLYDVSTTRDDLGFDPRPIVYLFLAIGFALILRHLAREKVDLASSASDASTTEDRSAAGDVSLHPVEPIEPALATIVEKELVGSKLYLNPFVSLDMLAERTGLPRHQLTLVFNQYYNKSFYQFIASARIEYAMDRMLDRDDSATLDSLSYECGFNSKTSFNRYFKEHTGMTPSAFRAAYCQQLSVQ